MSKHFEGQSSAAKFTIETVTKHEYSIMGKQVTKLTIGTAAIALCVHISGLMVS